MSPRRRLAVRLSLWAERRCVAFKLLLIVLAVACIAAGYGIKAWDGYDPGALTIEDCERAIDAGVLPDVAVGRIVHITQHGIRALTEQAKRDDEAGDVARFALVGLRLEINR